jgi:hypothetical protein
MWEYYGLKLTDCLSTQSVALLFDNLGKQGWELVGFDRKVHISGEIESFARKREN